MTSKEAPTIQRAVSYSDDEESDEIAISKKRKAELEQDSEKYKLAKTLLDSIALSQGCPATGRLLVDPSTLIGNDILDQKVSQDLGNWKLRVDTRLRAEHGDTGAMIAIGKWFEYGNFGFPENHGEAYSCYLQAAERGDVQGMAEAGACLVTGFGVTQCIPSGIYLLHYSAHWGSASARRSLGDYYNTFRMQSEDYDVVKFGVEKAEHWYKNSLDERCAWPLDMIDRGYVEADLKRLKELDVDEYVDEDEEEEK